MSESSGVHKDTPAIQALRSRRFALERLISEGRKDVARAEATLESRQSVLDCNLAERDDIDNAIKALSYPNPYGGVSTG